MPYHGASGADVQPRLLTSHAEDLASSTESSFCYQAHARLSEAVEQQLRKAADRAAIAQELVSP